MGNPKEQALGQGQGDIQGFLDNSLGNPANRSSEGNFDPIQSIWGYYTKGLKGDQLDSLTKQYYGQAQNSLYGSQQRTAGNAGALATNQAFASGVSNPYAFGQHAQGNVYQGFADAFGGLKSDYLKQMMQNPLTAFGTQHAANQSNYENYYRMMALKQGLSAQRDTGYGEQLAGGLIGMAGDVGGAYLKSKMGKT